MFRNNKALKDIAKTILKLGITAFAMYWVFSNTDIDTLLKNISKSNPYLLILALLSFICSQFFASSRINSFFKGAGLHLSSWYNYKLYLLGMFYNMFLPGGIGGDAYKIFFLNKTFTFEKRKLFKAVFLDKLSGVWALFTLIFIMLVWSKEIALPTYVYFLVALLNVIYFILYARLFKLYHKLTIKTHLKALGLQFMQVISVILILLALGFEGNFYPYCILFLSSAFMALFPFTIGGLGSRELVFLYGAKYFDLNPQLAVTVSLVFFVISALASLPGVYFVFRPQALAQEKNKMEL